MKPRSSLHAPSAVHVSPEAERVFSEYLEQVGKSGERGFDDLCRAHAALAPELRELLSRWSAYDPLVAAHPRAETIAAPRDLIDVLGSLQDDARRYDVGDVIAQGGMGTVHSVWDLRLDRKLAMKTARVGSRARNAPGFYRFVREARIAARIDHPGIAPVHELGLDGSGRPFFTMKLIEGADFESILRGANAAANGFSRERKLAILLRAAEAVAYAHERGVVHRDLKPANLMVGRFGEVYVVDWGLAHLLGTADDAFPDQEDESEPDDDSRLTRAGAVVGTPGYMPPEQASGASADVDVRADVYSMGAILYEILTDHPPHRGVRTESSSDDHVRARPPIPVSELVPRAPAELAAVCEKAMAHDPRDRYPTMLEFADEIRAYLEGRVVRTYATGAMPELAKWVGRNRGLAAALAALVVVTIISSVVVAARERANAKLLENERNEARNARIEAESNAKASQALVEFLNSEFLSLGTPTGETGRGPDTPFRDVIYHAAKSVEGRFEGMPASEAYLRHAFGLVFATLGDNATAERELRVAADLRRQVFGDRNEYTLNSLNCLGLLLSQRGNLDESRAVLMEVLDARHAQLGEGDLATLRTLQNIAITRARQGHFDEAIAIQTDVLEGRRRLLGESDPLTCASMANLATMLRRVGRIDEAQSLLVDALSGQRDALGPNHPLVATSQLELAKLLQIRGEVDAAAELCFDAILTRRASMSESDRGYRMFVNSAATLLNLLGRPLDALALREPIASIPGTADDLKVIRLQYAKDLTNAGLGEQALPLLWQALEEMDTGSDAWRDAARATAAAYRELGRIDRAAEWECAGDDPIEPEDR